MIHAMAAEIIRDEMPLPFVRKVPAADDFEAGVFRLAGVEALEDARELVRQAAEGGAGEGIIDALAISAVGRETLAPFVEDVAPRIDLAHRENLEPSGFRAVLPDAA